MRRSTYHLPALLAAGSLAAALSLAPTTAQAFDQRVEDGIHHYIECFKFMVTDEASHKAFCSPSRGGEWFIPESEYSGSPAVSPPDDDCGPPAYHKSVKKSSKKGFPNLFQTGNHQVPFGFGRR